MLTYQVRSRVFRHDKGQRLVFPNTAEVVFLLKPEQPFGVSAGGGRTAVRAVAATIFFDANSGHGFVESQEALGPLDVTLIGESQRVSLKGNELRIADRFGTLSELASMVQTVFHILPPLLNVEFADPPYIERVEGKVGDVPFRWELSGCRVEFETTSHDAQEQKAAKSLERLALRSYRIVAAIHYFHVFCRLCRAGHSPWEFMSEGLVNLSKTLEVLFPPDGDGLTLNAVRLGLRDLGYAEWEIEGDFIPAMCLRNHIDGAHVDLSVFPADQLQVLHEYTERAEVRFREMLKRFVDRVEAGTFRPADVDAPSQRRDAEAIIARLAKHLAKVDAERARRAGNSASS